jgi:hypothetical protein
MSLDSRIGETLRRTVPKLAPEVRLQLEALMTKESLAIMASVLTAWVVSHAVGIGEVIDAVLVTVGVLSIGWAVFVGIDHLYDFASGVYSARSEDELERASEHLAKAISILGIQAVLAVLFRSARAPRTGRGGRLNVGPAPQLAGVRYRPRLIRDPSRPPGTGATSFWGDIVISTKGSAQDQALVILHERVHQALAPKFFLLRNYRVSNRAGSYVRSSLWRYIEEAMAETVAQVGVRGVAEVIEGVRFPVSNGYVYLTRTGGYNPQLAGSGVFPEAAALIHQGIVAGVAWELKHQAGAAPVPTWMLAP